MNNNPELDDLKQSTEYWWTAYDKCNERVCELLAENLKYQAIIAADTHILLSKRPIAWRVYCGSSHWQVFTDETKANEYSALFNNAPIQGLYARDGK